MIDFLAGICEAPGSVSIRSQWIDLTRFFA